MKHYHFFLAMSLCMMVVSVQATRGTTVQSCTAKNGQGSFGVKVFRRSKGFANPRIAALTDRQHEKLLGSGRSSSCLFKIGPWVLLSGAVILYACTPGSLQTTPEIIGRVGSIAPCALQCTAEMIGRCIYQSIC